ncbi:pre-mRNA-splicing factor ATP-dependent RNA helicase PRP16 [Angomonas deanei]|uniref:RNA helicase n=1 Tax=Angomonas deanei TaxID=59799 RepID=A0A7G2CKF0_9TRYP|nr:pre-mRNA-splicing factor ATP-dependent RNA helicase PRP16 [Angomonas deanei]CAD2219879.1 DEAD/DEAH box helicase/Helicase conserved C-terminal domain/Helicase associated domain (HA2)/Oligonucleotide/oligosaccharide-binding (OB)-fold, putative [Angomonas deanei]|eukprot:EPY17061.1 pre-mRNA-splicing factor ATP-dependent RNA helicase PRP16 [Angomonas deanei]
MEREKQSREVMSTAKSDLTRLYEKDTQGREVMDSKPQQSEEPTDTPNLEEEALLRRIRLEKMKQDATAETENNATIVKKKKFSLHDTPHEETDALRSLSLFEQKRSLPIYQVRKELLRCIGENAVTIVVGETGSGKTTQLVQYLHEAGYCEGGKRIGCTQPRRLAAIGVARRVSEEMQVPLGGLVGYAIHLDDTTTEETRIKFMTDGVLLREVVKDADVNGYSVIVLDEAHERSVDTDVLMGVLLLAVRRRKDLKLVVTSATMDVEKFSQFFGNAPFFGIPGRTFEVQVHYSPSPVTDYVAEAVFRVCQIHLQTPIKEMHDILVFMTGRDDVYGTCELIKRRLQEVSPSHVSSLLLIPCLSEASSNTIDAAGGVGVLDPTPTGYRKCVVATNVAETSLTIDGVRYVIDCGFMKANVYRPKIGMNTLQRYPVSQAQAGQRKGRAGRTTEGVCFRLYTEDQFQREMLPNTVPEIQRSSVDSVLLLLKSIEVKRIIDFEFMDPPPVANIRNSMWHLWMLGLLHSDGSITRDGQLALEFPVSPSLAKLILLSTQHNCAVEVLKLVSMITADTKNLFETPKGREEAAQQSHSRFYVNDSDHLTILNVLSQFLQNQKSPQWARDHFLHLPTLLRAVDVYTQLTERVTKLHLPLESCGVSQLEKVRYCLAKAFCLQSAVRCDSNWNKYRPLLNTGLTVSLHPGSALCARAEMPLYVIYGDLLFVSKEYMLLVTAVEPRWLGEAGGGLLKGREGGKVIEWTERKATRNRKRKKVQPRRSLHPLLLCYQRWFARRSRKRKVSRCCPSPSSVPCLINEEETCNIKHT